ncbi:MAG: NADH-quinone oxidoreductase subunit B family protein [Elusimicrobia bacterium]|jgi:NADH-quinone oxidoreductase B subunit|nr:NADH-quinone oxidoreductase subunit B family protein [Elusimicrobiota bacterium]
MNLKTKALKKSLWVYHMSGGSCNNCDIEILDCLTPKFDLERFGIVLVGSPRHADVLLCTGIVNKKCVERVKEVYEQTAKPCVVVAIGACACSGGMFRDSYEMGGPLNKIIPVDIYIPGCPPKPEAMIAGIVKVLEKLK